MSDIEHYEDMRDGVLNRLATHFSQHYDRVAQDWGQFVILSLASGEEPDGVFTKIVGTISTVESEPNETEPS